ncbi:hypothetical protein CYMTET_37525 [Cymbomonas tetramitiformis]|uniref:Uncharacterized protein n=1 Tax=Cymbomonas tetramitiformis TaxID=36881 RepID=A0AAE0CDR2_9CHLO|nr:hypothetical protein CYMTET_37525 [Cymbomonas tetramitiformis]
MPGVRCQTWLVSELQRTYVMLLLLGAPATTSLSPQHPLAKASMWAAHSRPAASTPRSLGPWGNPHTKPSGGGALRSWTAQASQEGLGQFEHDASGDSLRQWLLQSHEALGLSRISRQFRSRLMLLPPPPPPPHPYTTYSDVDFNITDIVTRMTFHPPPPPPSFPSPPHH